MASLFLHHQRQIQLEEMINFSKILSEQFRTQVMKDYFNVNGLVDHQIDSFNRFVNKDLKTIIVDEPDIRNKTADRTVVMQLNNIQVEPPTITNSDRTVRPLYPQEARNKNLNYSGNIYVDVIQTTEQVGKIPRSKEYYKVCIGKIPIMLMSDFCNLRRHTADYNESVHGHSKDDQGGYFLINGKERILVSQIRKAYNKPMCFFKTTTQKEDVLICEMRSMCDETFHSTSVQVKSFKKKMVVSLKLKKTMINVPVGVIFKSLGYDPNADDGKFDSLFDLPAKYDRYVNAIKKDCSFDKSHLYDDEDDEDDILKIYVNTSTAKDEDVTIEDVNKSLDMDLFPHLGITSTKDQKVWLLALMLTKYFKTAEKDMDLDSKDDYTHKRVETAGDLLNYLFKLMYKNFLKTMTLQFKNKPDISSFCRNSNITAMLAYCFATGNWGGHRNTYIRTGVCQVINPKVSTVSHYSGLRRLVIPESKDGKDTKTSEMRQIHPSSFFLICPVETPEGKGVGTILNMSVFCSVTHGITTCEMLERIERFKSEVACTCKVKSNNCRRIVVNGTPFEMGHIDTIKRLNFLNDVNISIVVNEQLKTIDVSTDAGRLIRPVYDLKKIKAFEGPMKPSFKFLVDNELVRFVDVSEARVSNMAVEPRDLSDNPGTLYDFMEMHPCGLFGVVAGTIPFSDRTQSARNCFYTSMVKQAIGYIPGHQLKTETVCHILNYPQRPLVTTDIAEFTGLNSYPNGINAIVAINTYTGYNQEDSVIINKSSVERGLFSTTTYTTHSAVEKKNGVIEKIEVPADLFKVRNCNYGLLKPNGVVAVGRRVVKGDVIIGKTLTKNKNEEKLTRDTSVAIQHNEEGCVDRVVDVVVNGCRTVKVVIAQLCIPEIGDKFCSGMAQKGTCGMIYAQEDMPFTASGMTPDIIINPNCIPSRMTINQIIATVQGKARCANPRGQLAVGNPFAEDSTDCLTSICDELARSGFDRSGVETMYCGLTGRRITCDIFMGPVYYHRLKHMVKDKMHSRCHGHLTPLNRQPNCGRSQGGGLRFGEMEKDCILVHGATQFLNERMFVCSDKFQVNICKDCGSITGSKSTCHVCKSSEVRLCNMPYAFKTLLQELNSVGLKIKISV